MTRDNERGSQGRSRWRNDLANERRAWKLSRKQVARIVGKSVDAIESYERGTRFPTIDTALKLQILFRSQIASFYLLLYQRLSAEVRTTEALVRRKGAR